EEYFKKFTKEEVRNTDMIANDYHYAVDWFADIWQAISPRQSWTISNPEPSAASDPEQSDTPGSEIYEPVEPVWDGRNWQDMLDCDVKTIDDTEHRLMGTKCPICQEPFKSGQKLKKYRCGHAVCIECFKQSKDEGW
ncbi:MAG: RING finger domain-containing protein, partial [Candidatus Fonsibacter sp.]